MSTCRPINPFPYPEPSICVENRRYTVRTARADDMAEVYSLRFRVFYGELNESLPENIDKGIDTDSFDDQFSHLIAIDNETGTIIGTYRIQAYETAVHKKGFYSNLEFNLSDLPENVLQNGIEMGRACIDKRYRNTSLLLMLWRGVSTFLTVHKKRYVFGCCSINSNMASVALETERYLIANGYVCGTHRVSVRPKCQTEYKQVRISPDPTSSPLPKLLAMYLKHGGKICSDAAYDRDFGTYDFFVYLDADKMTSHSRKLFFID